MHFNYSAILQFPLIKAIFCTEIHSEHSDVDSGGVVGSQFTFLNNQRPAECFELRPSHENTTRRRLYLANTERPHPSAKLHCALARAARSISSTAIWFPNKEVSRQSDCEEQNHRMSVTLLTNRTQVQLQADFTTDTELKCNHKHELHSHSVTPPGWNGSYSVLYSRQKHFFMCNISLLGRLLEHCAKGWVCYS